MKLVEEVNSANFFSVLLDGATDLGNNDNEVALVVWCEISASDERLHTRIAYLGVERPKNVSGIGLFDVLDLILCILHWISSKFQQCSSFSSRTVQFQSTRTLAQMGTKIRAFPMCIRLNRQRQSCPGPYSHIFYGRQSRRHSEVL